MLIDHIKKQFLFAGIVFCGLGICMSTASAQFLGNSEEDDQYYGEDSGSDAGTYKTKITTNTDGKVSQETREGSMAASGKEVDTSELDRVSASSSGSGTSQAQTQREVSSSKDQEEKVADGEYTGVYQDRQIIPNNMAIYCKLKAEDIMKDMTLMDECIKKYVRAINNKNATEKTQGIKDSNILKYNLLSDSLATSVAKTASVGNYEDKMNDYANASSKQATKFDNEEGLIQTISFFTDVLNGMRELYAEDLKYKAIAGIIDIDPAVLGDVAGENDTEKTTNVGTTDASYTNITAQTVAEGGSSADGFNNEIDGGEIQEVIVSGSSKLDKFAQMSPEEFAQNTNQVNQLRSSLQEVLNSPDSTDSEIAQAQRALDRLNQIENEKKSAQKTSNSDLEAAKNLSPAQFKKALERYRDILSDPSSDASIKSQAQYYIDILNQAAPIVLQNMPCAQAKRELGLSVSCDVWNNQDKTK